MEMTVQSLEEILRNVGDLTMDHLSHKICLIKRPEKNVIGHQYCIQPITDYVQSKLALRLRVLDSHQQIALYRSYVRIPRLKGMSGYIFEGFCHRRFQNNIHIQYVQMVRLDRKTWKRQPRWNSSHVRLQDSELDAHRQNARRNSVTLDVHPVGTQEYGDDLPTLEPKEDVYYVPKIENEIALDSFILHSNQLHVFQFTCSDAHDIKDGLVSRLAGCTKFPPFDEWHFIFVIPKTDEVFKCPYQQNLELQKLKLFSAQVSMDDDQEKLVPQPESSKTKTPLSIGEEEEPPPKKSKVTYQRHLLGG